MEPEETQDSDATEETAEELKSLSFNVQNLRDTRPGFLMVRFVDGYAPGWKMAVSEAFQETLDIKPTTRQVIIGKDEKGKAITRAEALLTQGNEFSFKQGDMIWDSKSIYPTWEEQLKHTTLGVQVVEATQPMYEVMEVASTFYSPVVVKHQKRVKGQLTNPQKAKVLESLTIERSRWLPGTVRFKVLRPNADKTKVEYGEVYTTTQDDFVLFLQTGVVWPITREPPIDLFKVKAPAPSGELGL
ncbi:MAG: hypothetical protein ISR64_08605 [Deltaproteobacteria bacterium]|nr:hypothetical protein [Deltaproteobacteria bacterium]